MRVNIIGAGLAGCALAYTLKNQGHEPVIYEAGSEVAGGASGNDVGLYNPRISAQLDPSARYYKAAFDMASELFASIGEDIDARPCGILSLMNNEKKHIRFSKAVASWEWSEDDFRIVSSNEASALAGVAIDCSALFMPKSGKISPKKLCAYYARGVEVHLNHPIEGIDALEGDVTVLACGFACTDFEGGEHLPLSTVRGQVSYIKENAISSPLKTVLSYGGYIAPSEGGVHSIGSTFQRWLDHTDLLAEDDARNIDMLCTDVPSLKSPYDVTKSRAGLRTTSRDYFPVVGKLADGVYISTAHGSHGIVSSLLSAHILSESIVSREVSVVDSDVISALAPQRFR